MGTFNLDEVLQIAMQAEESGRRLYDALGQQARDVQLAELCRRLAQQEQGHYEKFKAMRDAQANTLIKHGLGLDDLDFIRSLVNGTVLPSEEEAQRAIREDKVLPLLDMAIAAEVGSVKFYGQLLPHVESSETATVGEIIEEEKRHEKLLREVKQRMSGK